MDPVVIIDEQLQNFRGSDDDYFAQNVADHIFKIVYDIQEVHRKDITASPYSSIGKYRPINKLVSVLHNHLLKTTPE